MLNLNLLHFLLSAESLSRVSYVRKQETSFTSTNVKLRLRFDVFLTSTDIYMSLTWPPDHHLTFPWPLQDPYLTLDYEILIFIWNSLKPHLTLTWSSPGVHLTFTRVQNSLHNFMQTTYTGCLKQNARSCLKPDISRLEAQILTSKDSFDIVMFSAFKWAQEQCHFTWKWLRKSCLKSANST